jgi:hypothetical protein
MVIKTGIVRRHISISYPNMSTTSRPIFQYSVGAAQSAQPNLPSCIDFSHFLLLLPEGQIRRALCVGSPNTLSLCALSPRVIPHRLFRPQDVTQVRATHLCNFVYQIIKFYPTLQVFVS